MAKFGGVSFSGEELSLEEVAAHHADVHAAVTRFFSLDQNPVDPRFRGLLAQQLADERGVRLAEQDRLSTFVLLAAVEAVLRMDYLLRCHWRRKDPLSRSFRVLFREKRSRVSLEDDLLERWKEHAVIPAGLISELKGAFKYRHWLAHGRYWTPKVGKSYDFKSVFAVAKAVFDGFPLESV